MKQLASLSTPVLGMWLLFTMPSCIASIDDEPVEEPTLSETSSDLSVTSWAAPLPADASYRSAQTADLNGTTILVRSGRCGSWQCNDSGEANDLYWQKKTETGWTPARRISGQHSNARVNLAPFNGYIYMVHTGGSNSSAVWLSKFHLETESWSENIQLSYVTHDGPPAITAYNNQLHFVGTNPTTHQLWHATMSPSEVFSSAQPMAGHFSASRVSTAAYGGRLYLVHRAGATDAIVYNSFDGTSWGADQFVPNGSGGAPITGPRPVIAAVNGYLHLAHRRPGSDQVWWTYFNGCAWASEVTIGNRTSTYDPSLAAGGPGLNLITTSDDTSLGDLRTRFVRLSQFHAPPAPRFPPLCNIVIHPL